MVISCAMAGGISFFCGDCAVVAFCPWAVGENTRGAASARVRTHSVKRENRCWNFICALSILTLQERRRLAEFGAEAESQTARLKAAGTEASLLRAPGVRGGADSR